ncbi:MAG: hypothetical protein HY287_15045 [Planctomycetes bacterium]|nr:hypothetical protein [Planctomycetota bacterium]
MFNTGNNADQSKDNIIAYVDRQRTIVSWNEVDSIQYPSGAFVIDYVRQQVQYPVAVPAIMGFDAFRLSAQPRDILAAFMRYVGMAVGTSRVSEFLGRQVKLASAAMHNAKTSIVKVLDLAALGLTLNPARGSLLAERSAYILNSSGRSCVVIVPEREFNPQPISKSR